MLNLLYLKFSRILHPRYHPKIMKSVPKNKEKQQQYLNSWDYMINHNENEDENEK